MEKFPITKDGFDKLTRELRYCKTVERPDIIRAIVEARAHGDLSENAEYTAAKEKQSFIEARIANLQRIANLAEVIDTAALNGDIVQFGAYVTLLDYDNDEEIIYQIVGEYEADIRQKRLSILAPLALALISKKIGEIVEVEIPKGSKVYEILNIEYR
ncbi:transcription elongation factor GreA [Rickettsiales bacterium]|nr:transcription elongation factor GreA [Rickettsiales bacterium]